MVVIFVTEFICILAWATGKLFPAGAAITGLDKAANYVKGFGIALYTVGGLSDYDVSDIYFRIKEVCFALIISLFLYPEVLLLQCRIKWPCSGF